MDSVGEGEGGEIWENGIETYIISCMKRVASSRFNAWYWMLGAGALGQPRGMVWGERREEGSGWGTHVYLWRIHFDVWQNQYNIVKFKNKMKLKKKTLNFYFIFWITITEYSIIQMDCKLFSQSPIAKHVCFLFFFNYKWFLSIFDVEEINKKYCMSFHWL